jgi:DNA-binding beta-propeller fold protein YncE
MALRDATNIDTRAPTCTATSRLRERIFVADDHKRSPPLRYSHSFGEVRPGGGDRFWRPDTALYLPDGSLVLSDTGHSRLIIFNRDERSVLELDGEPTGLASDGRSLFVATGHGQCVQRLPLAGEGRMVRSDSAALRFPRGMALSEQLFVADATADCVHVLSAGALTYVRSLGSGQLWGPSDVAVDAPRARLFVADSHNDRVAVLCRHTGSVLHSIGGASGRSTSIFRSPTGVTLHQGLLLVAEGGGCRVQALTPQGEPLQAVAPALQNDREAGRAASLDCGGLSSIRAHGQRVAVVDFEVHAVHFFDCAAPPQ